MDRTTIGKSIEIDGEITGADGVVVLGHVKGRVDVEQGVVVERGGRMHAEVDAESVFVAGEIEGRISARTRVEITADGSAVGDIRAPRIVIADGAHFKGSIEMEG